LFRALSVPRRGTASDLRNESGAEADVRVRIGTGVEQIEREHTCVRRVVPVPATIGQS